MQIPCGIGFYGIEPTGFELQQPIAPISARHTKVVHGARNNGKGFPIHKKFITPYGKLIHSLLLSDRSRGSLRLFRQPYP